MSNRSKFIRKQGIYDADPSILIVCEGKKTEKNYFKSFRIPNKKVPRGMGKDPKNLVDYAIQKKNEFNQVWCVFDEDLRGKQFDTAIKRCEKIGINVAYSNSCFELWFLLHFEDVQANTFFQKPQKLADKLDQYLPYGKDQKYSKDDYNHYSKLLKTQKKAIERARKLEKSYPDGIAYHKRKNTTTVFKLVEELNSYQYKNGLYSSKCK